MHDPLFDPNNRTGTGLACVGQPPFAKYGQRMALLLEEWYALYPDPHYALRTRFHKGGQEHASALFEIFLRGLITHLGLAVEVDPGLPSGQSKPDFLVSNGACRAYIEATVINDPISPPALQEEVFETIDSLRGEIPDTISLSTEIIGTLQQAPPKRPIKDQIRQWLAGVDPHELETSWHEWLKEAQSQWLQERREQGKKIPGDPSLSDYDLMEIESEWGLFREEAELTFARPEYLVCVQEKYGDWKLTLRAHADSSRPAGSRVIVRPHEGGWQGPSGKGLYQKIGKKIRQHGAIGEPLVIAVLDNEGIDEEMETALFGRPELITWADENGRALSNEDGRYYQQWVRVESLFDDFAAVSAVWVFRWTTVEEDIAEAILYLNPNTGACVPEEMRRLGWAEVKDGRIDRHPGLTAGDLFEWRRGE